MSSFIITNIKTTKENFVKWKAILALQNRNIGEELGRYVEDDIKKNKSLLEGKANERPEIIQL